MFFQHRVYGSQNRWGHHYNEQLGFLDVPDHLGVAEHVRRLQAQAGEAP